MFVLFRWGLSLQQHGPYQHKTDSRGHRSQGVALMHVLVEYYFDGIGVHEC